MNRDSRAGGSVETVFVVQVRPNVNIQATSTDRGRWEVEVVERGRGFVPITIVVVIVREIDRAARAARRTILRRIRIAFTHVAAGGATRSLPPVTVRVSIRVTR